MQNAIGNHRIPIIKTSLSSLTGIGFFFCIFLLFFIVVTYVCTFLMAKMTNETASLRIATLLQDIFIFILPAVVTALMMTRLPARFLFIDNVPQLWSTILAIATLFVAMPWMNVLIEWNESFTFPESMKEIGESLRATEDAAAEFVKKMLKGSSIGSLLVSVCIIGILAGLSEELFFRGTLLRLFFQTRMNPHIAIWSVAVIFSLMHFQFFGFIPRLVLGAYFGYLVYWTRNLWIPIIVHAINNSTVVVTQWYEANSGKEVLDPTSHEAINWVYFSISILFTIGCIYLLIQQNKSQNA